MPRHALLVSALLAPIYASVYTLSLCSSPQLFPGSDSLTCPDQQGAEANYRVVDLAGDHFVQGTLRFEVVQDTTEECALGSWRFGLGNSTGFTEGTLLLTNTLQGINTFDNASGHLSSARNAMRPPAMRCADSSSRFCTDNGLYANYTAPTCNSEQSPKFVELHNMQNLNYNTTVVNSEWHGSTQIPNGLPALYASSVAMVKSFFSSYADNFMNQGSVSVFSTPSYQFVVNGNEPLTMVGHGRPSWWPLIDCKYWFLDGYEDGYELQDGATCNATLDPNSFKYTMSIPSAAYAFGAAFNPNHLTTPTDKVCFLIGLSVSVAGSADVAAQPADVDTSYFFRNNASDCNGGWSTAEEQDCNARAATRTDLRKIRFSTRGPPAESVDFKAPLRYGANGVVKTVEASYNASTKLFSLCARRSDFNELNGALTIDPEASFLTATDTPSPPPPSPSPPPPSPSPPPPTPSPPPPSPSPPGNGGGDEAGSGGEAVWETSPPPSPIRPLEDGEEAALFVTLSFSYDDSTPLSSSVQREKLSALVADKLGSAVLLEDSTLVLQETEAGSFNVTFTIKVADVAAGVEMQAALEAITAADIKEKLDADEVCAGCINVDPPQKGAFTPFNPESCCTMRPVTPVGAIVGGTIGGVVVLLICVGIAVGIFKHNQKAAAGDGKAGDGAELVGKSNI